MSGLQVFGVTQYVSTRMPHFAAELDRVEAHTVAEAARRVHEAGYRFLGWPTVTRTWLGFRAGAASLTSSEVHLPPGDARAWHVRIQLEVMAEER